MENIKEKLKTREPCIHRQAVRSLLHQCITSCSSYEQLKNHQCFQTLLNLVKQPQQGFLSISFAAMDAIIEIGRQSQKKAILDVSSTLSLLTDYAVSIHSSLLPNLIRGILELIILVKPQKNGFIPQQIRQTLISLINNRPEVAAELVYQAPQFLTRSDLPFEYALKLFSPFFAHILSNRSLVASSVSTPNGITSNSLRLQLIRELSHITHFMGKSKKSITVLLYLFHFVPTFEFDDIDINTSCILPCTIIIDLIIEQFEGNSHEEQNDGQLLGNTLICLMLRHLLSLYCEIKQNNSCSTDSLMNQVLRILHLYPFIFVQHLPFICSSIITAETQVELDYFLMILSKTIDYIISDVNSATEHLCKSFCFADIDPQQRCDRARVAIMLSMITSLSSLLYILYTAIDAPTQNRASVCLSKVKKWLDNPDKHMKPALTEKQQKPLCTNSNNIISKLKDIRFLFTRSDVILLESHYQKIIPELFSLHNCSISLNLPKTIDWIEGFMAGLKNEEKPDAKYSVNPYTLLVISSLLFLSRQDIRHLEVSFKRQSQYDEKEESLIQTVRSNLMKLITVFCTRICPVRAGLFFQPVVLYEISRVEDAQAKLDLMYLLPKLGTSHFVCVTSAVKILNSFLQDSSLVPIALQLFTDIFMENERFFPRLKSTLISVSKYKHINIEDLENPQSHDFNNFNVDIRISIANCVKRICEKSSAKGSEMISLLCKILCQDYDPTVLILGLQALYHLCSYGVVDFFTIWYKVISNNIMKHTSHHILLSEVCRLYQFGAETELKTKDTEDDEYDILGDYLLPNRHLTRRIMLHIWDLTRHESALVRKTAFETLSHYEIKAHIYAIDDVLSDDEDDENDMDSGQDIDHYEQEKKKQEDLLSQHERKKTILVSLGNLLTESIKLERNRRVHHSAVPLLSSILKVELLKPRFVMQDSSMSIETSESSYFTSMHAVVNNYSRFIVKEYESKGNIYRIIAPALLWTASPSNTDSISRSSQSYYRRVCNDLIKDVSLGSSNEDFFAHILLSQGYFSFVRRYYGAQLAEERKKQAKNQTNLDTVSLSFNSIFEELKHFVDGLKSPSEVENSLLAMTALSSLISSTHSHVDRVNQLIKKMLLNPFDLEEWVIYACNLGLACGSYHLTHSPSQLTEITSLLLKQVNDATNQENLNSVTSGLSSAIALGIIGSKLCQGDITEIAEKSILKDAAEVLYNLCFSKNIGNFDAKAVSSIMVGLSMMIEPLIKTNEVQFAQNIYSSLVEEFMKLDDDCFRGTPKDSPFLYSCCFVLPKIAIQMLKLHIIKEMDIIDLISKYWNMILTLETKNLPIFFNYYRNCCVGFGSLIFSMFIHSENSSKDNESVIHLGNAEISKYINHLMGIVERPDTSSSIKIGSLLGISAILGVDVMSPVPPELSKDLEIGDYTDSEHQFLFKNLFSAPAIRHNFEGNIQQELSTIVTKSFEFIKRIYALTTIDSKVRRYSALLLGAICCQYKTKLTPEERELSIKGVPKQQLKGKYLDNTARINLKLLNEQSLSMKVVQLLENGIPTGEEKIRTLVLLETYLLSLLQCENLPKINWSNVLQKIMKGSSPSSLETENISGLVSLEDQVKESIRNSSIQLLCKEACSVHSSGNSRKALSLLCEKQRFINMPYDMQQVIVQKLLVFLSEIFPISRSAKLFADLYEILFQSNPEDSHHEVFKLRIQLLRSLATIASNCADTTPEDIHPIMKAIQDFTRTLKDQYLPSVKIIEENHNTILLRKEHFDIAHHTSQILQNMPTKLVEELFVTEKGSLPSVTSKKQLISSMVANALLRVLMNYRGNSKDNDPSLIPLMKSVREEICLDAPKDLKYMSNLFIGLIVETLLSYSPLQQSKSTERFPMSKKWVEDGIDILSFLLAEAQHRRNSPEQKNILHNEDVVTVYEKLDRLLSFLAGTSLSWFDRDLYLTIFADNQLVGRTLRACTQSDNMLSISGYAYSSHLLLFSLSSIILRSKLEANSEASLLPRLYAILTQQHQQTATPQASNEQCQFNNNFVLPLLIQIRYHRVVSKSWIQLAPIVEAIAIESATSKY